MQETKLETSTDTLLLLKNECFIQSKHIIITNEGLRKIYQKAILTGNPNFKFYARKSFSPEKVKAALLSLRIKFQEDDFTISSYNFLDSNGAKIKFFMQDSASYFVKMFTEKGINLDYNNLASLQKLIDPQSFQEDQESVEVLYFMIMNSIRKNKLTQEQITFELDAIKTEGFLTGCPISVDLKFIKPRINIDKIKNIIIKTENLFITHGLFEQIKTRIKKYVIPEYPVNSEDIQFKLDTAALQGDVSIYSDYGDNFPLSFIFDDWDKANNDVKRLSNLNTHLCVNVRGTTSFQA